MNRAPVAPRHTAPLPLIRYVRGTTEQEAAEPAVLREGSSSGSGAALRTTTVSYTHLTLPTILLV